MNAFYYYSYYYYYSPLLSRPQFPPLLPGMEVKTDGETDVKAHLVLRGKMVIQVLDYRDIEPQMSKLISLIEVKWLVENFFYFFSRLMASLICFISRR